MQAILLKNGCDSGVHGSQTRVLVDVMVGLALMLQESFFKGGARLISRQMLHVQLLCCVTCLFLVLDSSEWFEWQNTQYHHSAQDDSG